MRRGDRTTKRSPKKLSSKAVMKYNILTKVFTHKYYMSLPFNSPDPDAEERRKRKELLFQKFRK